jgi:hypothetical protein
MNAQITTISGIVSLYIYNYNDKKIYLFGDRHFSRQGSCQEQGYKCDYFNPTFTKTFTYNTECTTIGALLHNWLTYNNDHDIKTDFYIESFYTKENKRYSSQKFNTIIQERKQQNITNSLLIKSKNTDFYNKGWLELMVDVLNPCLVKDKTQCPFYPNVHVHYVDVRVIETNELVEVTPYSKSLLKQHINKVQTMSDFNIIKDHIVTLFDFLIYYHQILFDVFFDIYGYQNLKKLNHMLFDEMDNSLNLLVVTRQINGKNIMMYKVAWELYKLSLIQPDLADYIKTFIINKGYKIINDIKNTYKYDKLNLVDIDALNELINQYDDLLLEIQSLTMDAYTLARLFYQQDNDEMIIYAGNYHILTYVSFFNAIQLEQFIAYPYQGNRCVTHYALPNYLNANIYRDYAINKHI